MSEQPEIKPTGKERECIHRNQKTEGDYYTGTNYIKALQRLPVSAAMKMAGNVGAFFWADAPNIKVWLCSDCARELDL